MPLSPNANQAKSVMSYQVTILENYITEANKGIAQLDAVAATDSTAAVTAARNAAAAHLAQLKQIRDTYDEAAALSP